jgi:hypothetical protein
MRTPVNIAKYSLERTPLNFLRIGLQRYRGELKGGKMSEELARPILGTLLGAYVMQLASDGLVTGGGPSDPNERRVLYEAGWQPYSVKIGDEYHSFYRFEPIASVAGMAADLHEGWDTMTPGEQGEMVDRIATSISRNVTSKTFLTGLIDFSAAISDPTRQGERWVQRMAGSVIPTGVAQVARATDRTFRRPESLTESMKARIPGKSTEVPARIGPFGQESRRGGGTLWNLFSPVYISQISADPARRELARLRLRIGLPGRDYTVKGNERRFTADEYRTLQEEVGGQAYTAVSSFVQSPQYKRLTDEQRRDGIQRRFRDARDAGRRITIRQIMRTPPETVSSVR